VRNFSNHEQQTPTQPRPTDPVHNFRRLMTTSE
jgi:hypothetical protein